MNKRRAWLLVGSMWVAYLLNYADRQVVFSIFPLLKSELNLNDTQLGLTGSVFLWVYAICSPVAGQIGDRVSKRMLVVLSLLLWSGATFLTGLSHSVSMLLACRALIGVTESLFIPAAIALTANAHGPQTRSRAVAVLGTAQLAGIVTGGWYGGFVAQEFYWRVAFFSLGVLGICYAIPYLVFLRNTRLEGRVETIRAGGGLALATLAKIPSYRFLCVVFTAFTFALWLLYTWLPNFLYEKYSLSLAQAGVEATVFLQSATLVGMLVGGVMADRLYRRTRAARSWLVFAGLLICSPCLHWIGNANSLLLLRVAAVGFGFSGGLCMANFMVSAFEFVPVDTQASAVGCLNFIGGFVSGFAALLGGMWKRSLGIHLMLSYAALICAVAALLFFLGIRFYFRRDFSQAHPQNQGKTGW